MKAILVDDSKIARMELEELLCNFNSIDIVGRASDSYTAITQIQQQNPDLIFLDVDMPGKNGFELLKSLEYPPLVIFTTGYEEYALDAFDNHAIDYLVKPIDPKRLEKAINKALQFQDKDVPKTNGNIHYDNQIFIRDREKCWFLKLKEIRLFETYGNYCRVFFNNESVLIHKSLSELEKSICPNNFFRVSRQHIVNLNYVAEINLWKNDSYRITMNTGKEIDVSRRKSKKLKDTMSL
jgi:two-component system LytT family response regulator